MAFHHSSLMKDAAIATQDSLQSSNEEYFVDQNSAYSFITLPCSIPFTQRFGKDAETDNETFRSGPSDGRLFPEAFTIHERHRH
jgi:hypothetical protein